MRKFESEVQHIKYKVLKEIAKNTIEDSLEVGRYKIPKDIVEGPNPITRCCVYKERAIVEERVDLVIEDGLQDGKPLIEVLEIACDECPAQRFKVTEACRGCLAHRCINTCPKSAISVVDGRAFIDQDKCIECGRCKDACPFNAISDVMRPCKKACGSKAIEIGEDKKAKINRDKCTSCGSCVYQCPFGAITERSQIVSIIDDLEASKKNGGKNIYAVVAPAISSQFNATIGKVVNGIRKMGFKDVVEAALGADIVAQYEAMEFVDKVGRGKQTCMMTSCCPAFVTHIEKNYPELQGLISSMVSPMVAAARFIKKTDPDSKVVFIGPCTAKKGEAVQDDIVDAVDYVMTFEELDAVLDAYEIKLAECEDDVLDNASYYGRLFARSGGVKDAVVQVLKENGIEDVEFRPIACDGILECDKALKLLKFGKLQFNFIEGMACQGGCIAGAASLNHGPKDKTQVDKYAELAKEKEVQDSLRVINLEGINLHRHRE